MKVLICPLNWGLGHATRCIPLIRQMVEAGHEVVIATDGLPYALLKEEFPGQRFMLFPSYRVRYGNKKSMIIPMLRNIPHIISGVIREHVRLKKILKEESFDQIISDNRFGLWNKHVHSVYITHQLMIKMPGKIKMFEPAAWLLHRAFINRYNECLIPDYEGNDNLSGDLSHARPLPQNARFIGPLSRFRHPGNNPSPTVIYDTVIMISGIEPQRTLFENEMLHVAGQHKQEQILIIRGLPGTKEKTKVEQHVHIFPHLSTEQLIPALMNARKIICRSGYSSIMDLAAIDCLHKAEFHPTPGQTEQEYLAGYHNKKTAGALIK